MLKNLFVLCLVAALCSQALSAEPTGQATCDSQPDNGHHGQRHSAAFTARLHEWLQTLSPPQRLKAQAIIDEYRPQIAALHKHIAAKKSELELLSYDASTSPETLPRLGRELQELRDALHALLVRADQHMRADVGVPLGCPKSRGCRMEYPKTSPEQRP